MRDDEVPLKLDDRLKAQDLLYARMSHSGEGRVKSIAIGVAVGLHVIALLINFPEWKTVLTPEKPANVIVVKKYVPPPPQIERQQVVREKVTRKLPVPDPTPDEPEPIREPEPDILPEPLPPDMDFVIGVPDISAPPPTGPLIAGTGGVTNPVLIPESKVQPEYPELARVARVEGNVIIQAVIHKDGTVGEVEVLRCTRPSLGFEPAAIEAVKKWRYKPAMQGDRAVDVYFTVVVDFTLN